MFGALIKLNLALLEHWGVQTGRLKTLAGTPHGIFNRQGPHSRPKYPHVVQVGSLS